MNAVQCSDLVLYRQQYETSSDMKDFDFESCIHHGCLHAMNVNKTENNQISKLNDKNSRDLKNGRAV